MSPAGEGGRDRCELVVIGGTGWDRWEQAPAEPALELETPFGRTVTVRRFELGGSRLGFIARHGSSHALAPHQVNYRANVWAAAQLDPALVVAINTVGSLNRRLAPGALVVPDQIVDYTWGREHTFAGALEVPMHVDLTRPFDDRARARIVAADRAGALAAQRAVYGVTQGPRLETAAEIARMERDGCDLVGMTAMPEAALARELDLAYASVCVVSNWAAGIEGAAPIALAGIEATVAAARAPLEDLLEALARGLAGSQ